MRKDDAEEYTHSLGQIVAGGWRQVALGERLGVPKALGLSTQEWVNQRLGGYVKLSIAERHGAVSELKADGLSQRKIAGVLGVSEATISSDVSELKPEPIDAIAELAATNETEKAKKKQEKRREREQKLRDEREEKDAEARAHIERLDSAYELVVADLGDWRPEIVSSIITDPPYVGDSIPLYEKLRDFALDVLPTGAPLVVMTWQKILPEVIEALRHPELVYRWSICWRYANTENTVDYSRRVFDCWKPILVYHKSLIPEDVRMFRDEIASSAPDKEHHEWGQSVEGFERLVASFSEPGDVVCDPFLGGGTTAVAALASARRFVGCDIDKEAVETTKARLETRDRVTAHSRRSSR